VDFIIRADRARIYLTTLEYLKGSSLHPLYGTAGILSHSRKILKRQQPEQNIPDEIEIIFHLS